MQSRLWKERAVLLFILWPLITTANALGAAAGDAVIKAQQESEAKGYIFLTSHDEIVAAAKREGKLRLLGSLDPSVYKAMINAFKKQYPFVTDVHVQDTAASMPSNVFSWN